MPVERQSVQDASPLLEDPFQRLLYELATATAQGGDPDSLIQVFCRLARQFFQVSGVYCWKLNADRELVVVAADGTLAERLRDYVIPLFSGALTEEAVLRRRPLYINEFHADRYAQARSLGIRSALAVRLIVAGEAFGWLTFVHEERENFFDDEMATQATILATTLGSMMAMAQVSQQARDERQRAEDLAGVTIDLNSSLRLPDFARTLVQGASHIVGAGAAVLALSQAQGPRLEVVTLQEAAADRDPATLHHLNRVLNARAAEVLEFSHTPAAEFFGPELAATLGWQTVTLAPLKGAGDELIGLLCLSCEAEPSASQYRLLRVIALQAAVILENSRLFTRIETSKRNWIEIFDAITDFIVVHDDANTVLRVNRSLADFIGVRPSELIGIRMRALVSMAAEGDAQPCPFCRAGTDAYDEYIHPVLERTYLVSTSRIQSAINEGRQTIHVLKDITDRREAERRYRELFDNIQEGLFFSTTEGRFVEVNDTLVRMLGYGSRDELVQADIARNVYVDPAHWESFVQAITEHGSVRDFEATLRRKDGTLVHTLQNAFAVRDLHGHTIQYRGLMLDITESKTFQAALQRERDFSSKILNNTQSMILVADTAGLISYANRRCLVAGNFEEADLIGRRIVDLIPPNRRQVMTGALQAALDGSPMDNLELPLMFGGTQVGRFSVSLSPMRDEQGNVNSIVVVMTDVTDSAILQAKLLHTEKMAAVGQLVSGVAHEVNNPLTAILGFADLLLEQSDVPDSARKDLNIILQEAQRTKQIVQNLLSFARQMPPRRTPVQINNILQRTLSLRSYDLANHGVQVIQQFDPEMPELIADAHQIQQVFLNILNNAYDAVCQVGHPGRIEIRTSHTSNYAEIAFRDNGSGVNHPERIFDPFFTTKEVGKGTGLGLSICYGIVHEHGGEISCANNTHLEGATFLVRLPLSKAETAAPAAAGASRSATSGGSCS
ncbi:MAG TPA: PAS domain S-box protein [Anaerolineales bacterium]